MKGLFKKAVALLITLVFVLGTVSITPFAASADIAVRVDGTSFVQGDTVTAEVYFPESYNKVASLELRLTYDSSVLEFVEMKQSKETLAARDKQVNGEVYSQSGKTAGQVNWALAGGNNYEFSGLFSTVTFKVKSYASHGETALKLNVINASNSGRVNITSSINVEGTSFMVLRNITKDLTFKLNSKKTGYIITAYNCAYVDDVTIPDEYKDLPIVGIDDEAFMNHAEIKNLVLPASLEEIGDSSFNGCSGLTNLVIPDNVTKIGKSSFSGCSNLESVSLPVGLTSIGDAAFSDCYKLTSIELPFTLTSLGTGAFRRCYLLNEVKISKNTTIAANAFASCDSLVKFITVADAKNVTDYIAANGLTTEVEYKKDLSLGTMKIATNHDFIASAETPKLTVTLENSESVALGTDYKIIYRRNKKAGIARLFVVGINDYSEGYSGEYDIACKHGSLTAKVVKKAATCEETGIREYSCKTCGEVFEETIPAQGHRAGTSWTISLRPTIYKTGAKHKICTKCGEKCSITLIDKAYPDLNNDGHINSTDALIVLQYAVGDSSLLKTEKLFMNADTNGDNSVNSYDALTILQIAVGSIVL